MPGKTLPFENYTNDAQQVVVAAQRLAAEQKHAETTPLHLLARLLEHSHGVLELFRSAGADPNQARDLAELSLRELPKETSEVTHLSSHMLGLLRRAEREAQRERAALIGIEHLLHALAQEISGPTGEVLNALGINPGAFRPHISVLHRGKIEERLEDEQKHAETPPDLVRTTRRHGSRQGARLETLEPSFRRILQALRSHVCASFVGRTRAFGAAWVGLGEDARALAWAHAPLGGTRSAEADGAAADALSVVARALMRRGDRAEGHRIWSEAFDVLSCSAPSSLLALVAKAPLSDASVFDSAQKRVVETQSKLSGGAAGAWLALCAQTTMAREQREHLVQRAAWIFAQELPRLGHNEESLAQSALACALVALGKAGLLLNVSPLAVELAEAARTPTDGMRPGLREELAAQALEITGESWPSEGVSGNAGDFARRAHDALVQGGQANDAVRADFEQAKLRWSDFIMACDDGLIDSTELANARTNLAVLSAVFNEQEETLTLLQQIGMAAQAECAAELATTKTALAAVADGKPLALSVMSALETKTIGADALKKALENWSNAASRRDFLKTGRFGKMLLAEARARCAAGHAKGASELIDVVLAKTTTMDGGFKGVLSLPEVLYTMIALGRAEEAVQLAADEQYPGALAAQAVALLALGDEQAARVCMNQATTGPIRLVDALEIAVGLVGVMADPRASASALLGELAAGEADIFTMIPGGNASVT